MNASVDKGWQVAQRHFEAGRIAQAENFSRQVLQRAPNHAGALHLLGAIALRKGDAARAVGLIENALRVEDGDARMHNDLGQAWAALGQAGNALASYRRALELDPAFADALVNLGAVYARREEFADATDCYRKAIALRPELAIAHYNLGCVLFLAGQEDEASVSYERALDLNPVYIEAWLNLGLARIRQRRYQDAVDCYRRILSLKPDYMQAHINLGSVLLTMYRYAESAAHSRRAIALKPDSPLAHHNLALALCRGKQYDEAVVHARRAIELRPGYPEGYVVLGESLYYQGKVAQAMECYREVLAHRPRHIDGHKALTFAMLNAGGDREELWSLFRRFADVIEGEWRGRWPTHANSRDPGRRLKIGYVSPDLREHSVATFFEPVLARHDHDAFEVYCYSTHPKVDAVTERLRALADHWVPAMWMSDEALAARVQADGIDILVDLAGYTSGSNLGAFARKPAPVQVSWLGFPATTGLAAIDWRIVTADTDPPGEERWHSERLYRLPRSLWCYLPRESQRPARKRAPMLDRDGEVRFGSMNTLAKISAWTIETWARILNTVSGSKLVMTGVPEGEARRVLAESFGAHGVAADRLVMNGRLDDEAYSDLFDDIDFALDPFPYNGTTTTCETLWRGVPLVTLEGESSVARSGLALLKLLGLEALVAKDVDAYVELAVSLAGDPERLTELRSGLRERFEHSALRDEDGFARDLEAGYREMWQEWCEGRERKPPRRI